MQDQKKIQDQDKEMEKQIQYLERGFICLKASSRTLEQKSQGIFAACHHIKYNL